MCIYRIDIDKDIHVVEKREKKCFASSSGLDGIFPSVFRYTSPYRPVSEVERGTEVERSDS